MNATMTIVLVVVSLSLASAGYAQEPVPVPVQTIPIILQLKIEPVAQSPQPVANLPPAVAVLPDYTALLQSILTNTKLLADVQAQQLVLEKDTNSQLTAINKTWVQSLGDFGTWCAKYVAPAVLAYIAAKKL
jgi:hypothetical protein